MRLVFLAPLLVACESDVTYSGHNMDVFFPFDGERTWEFVSTDSSLPYKLVSTLDSSATTGAEGEAIFEVKTDRVCVNTETGCVDAWERSVAWSSDRTNGTRIHSVETGAGTTTFDPPLQLTDGVQLVGTVMETDVDGTTWSSTFVGLDQCPVIWTDQWGDQCILLQVDDGGAGSPVAGKYWAITQYNVVAFELGADTGTWQLSYATYE